MSGFLHCYRRKFGCIMLVIAGVVLRICCGTIGVKYPIDITAIVSILIAGIAMISAIHISEPRDFAILLKATVRAVTGACIGIFVLSDFILRGQYAYDHGFGESAKSTFIAGAIGTVVSGLFGALQREFRNNSEDDPTQQT